MTWFWGTERLVAVFSWCSVHQLSLWCVWLEVWATLMQLWPFSNELIAKALTDCSIFIYVMSNNDFVCRQLRAQGWMEGDDFNTQAVMNICGECGFSKTMTLSSYILLKCFFYLFHSYPQYLPSKNYLYNAPLIHISSFIWLFYFVDKICMQL